LIQSGQALKPGGFICDIFSNISAIWKKPSTSFVKGYFSEVELAKLQFRFKLITQTNKTNHSISQI